MDIKQWMVRQRTVRFQTKRNDYVAVYLNPIEGVPQADEGYWVLSEFVYQSHRRGQPIKKPRNKQIPRFKRVGAYKDIEACRRAIEQAQRQ